VCVCARVRACIAIAAEKRSRPAWSLPLFGRTTRDRTNTYNIQAASFWRFIHLQLPSFVSGGVVIESPRLPSLLSCIALARQAGSTRSLHSIGMLKTTTICLHAYVRQSQLALLARRAGPCSATNRPSVVWRQTRTRSSRTS
jgi:hypothetical protein